MLTGELLPSGFWRKPLQVPVMGGMGVAVTVPWSSQLGEHPVTVYVPLNELPVPLSLSVMTSPFMACEVRVRLSPQLFPQRKPPDKAMLFDEAPKQSLKMHIVPETESPLCTSVPAMRSFCPWFTVEVPVMDQFPLVSLPRGALALAPPPQPLQSRQLTTKAANTILDFKAFTSPRRRDSSQLGGEQNNTTQPSPPT